MLTVKQVAEMVAKSPKTIYRWIDEGRLKNVVKVGGGYEVPEKEVEKVKVKVNEEE